MRVQSRVAWSALAGALAIVILAANAYAIQVGQKAPDFALPSSNGKEVKLSDLLGKGPVVIFTFIQAFTGT
jgi:peroxiredoxin Q/BCP